MSQYFAKTLSASFQATINRVQEGLEKEGFGILTDIDMQETLKEKLGVIYPRYRILGACKPACAYKTLRAEVRIETMLPCHVAVREMGEDQVGVVAIDPVASMQAVGNPELIQVAKRIRERLQSVVENL